MKLFYSLSFPPLEVISISDHHHDIIIVGAGPVGSYASARLSKLGFDTLLIDRKPEIGRPVQCAGIVNSSMFDLPYLSQMKDDLVLKRINGADIYSPSGAILPLRGKVDKAFSIDRARFDHDVLKLAGRSSADISLNTMVSSAKLDKELIGTVRILKNDKEIVMSADMILGCDGPYSTIRRMIGFERSSETIPGVSLEMELKNGKVPSDIVAVMTGSDTAKGFFSWAIPSVGENGIRIGLSALTGGDLRTGLGNIFGDQRLKKFLSIDPDEEIRIHPIAKVFGSVPMGSPDNISKGPFLLLGDSAGMAKATSGGGIFPGLRAVDHLTKVIEKEGKIHRRIPKVFEQEWKKGYGKELSRTMVLRRIISGLTDKEIDRAVNAFNDERKLELINSEGDIDRPIQLAVKLIKMDPSILMLVPRYLPHLRKLL